MRLTSKVLMHSPQCPDYRFQKFFPTKRNQRSLVKQLIPGLGQDLYEMSMEYPVRVGIKQSIKTAYMSKESRIQLKEASSVKVEKCEQEKEQEQKWIETHQICLNS